MFSRLQGRSRAIFLSSLVILTIITGIMTMPRLFATSPHPPVASGTITGTTTATGNDGPSLSLPKWSSPATWQGKLPVAGAQVRIPAGQTILLDTSPPPLKSLIIEGTLICEEKDLALSANWILVDSGGALQCGTQQQPFQHHFVITLTGNNPNENILNMGTKLLGVAGGRLDLHGQAKVSWVHLAATAEAGASQLLLDEPVNWGKGDRIVIASTDFDPLHAEEFVIKAVSGNKITLNQPLQYMHWGQIQTFAGQIVDERAEVGLLSHNIVVQGDASSVQNGFGGQSMFMRGSTIHIEGVEFYHMGQFKHLARYPVHWHLAGDAPGDYIQYSSVDHSFNRCITIHGTNDLLVRENVTFDTIGHCYFMEDGTEHNNLLEYNLGVATLDPPSGMNLLPSDVRPATFWITNPDNYFIGNVAAGSQAQGFWFALPEHPTGLESNRTDVWPRQTPLGLFTENVAHSNEETGLFVDDGPNPDGTVDGYYYAPVKTPGNYSSAPVNAFFQNFTAYKQSFLGVWMRGYNLHLKGAILADNGDGAIFACNGAFLEDSLVVGVTANAGSNPDPSAPLNGFSFYDGLVGVKNVTFVNFQSNSQRPAGALSYHLHNSNPIDVLNFAQGIRFINANPVYLDQPVEDGDRAAVFLDVDGSVTGQKGAYVVANNPILADGACTFKAAWNSYVCKHHYVNLSIDSTGGQDIVPFTITRSDGVTTSQTGMAGTYVSVSALPGQIYTLHYAQTATTLQIDLQHAQAGDWIELVLPYSPANFRLYRDSEQNKPIVAAQSLDDFNTSQGDKYYYDQSQGLLYVKLIPQSGNDWARVNVAPA
jgi:cell surface hyaluronidase